MLDKIRCDWCLGKPLHIKYHDEEWGKLVTDDKKMFEFVVLESAQAGLSWDTILRKRDGYKKAFAGFDVNKVAAFTDKDVDRLMEDVGIIRNKLKIKSTISNAQNFIKIQNEFGSFVNYIKSFLPDGKPIVNHWTSMSQIPPRSEISDAIAKDMKKRGFKFFGTVICYSHLQATGYINDHLESCFCRSK